MFVCCECCQVEVSATDWSFVQRATHKVSDSQFNWGRSIHCIVHMILVGNFSYLQSVLRCKYQILDTCNPDTLYLHEQGCEDLLLFLKAERGPWAKCLVKTALHTLHSHWPRSKTLLSLASKSPILIYNLLHILASDVKFLNFVTYHIKKINHDRSWIKIMSPSLSNFPKSFVASSPLVPDIFLRLIALCSNILNPCYCLGVRDQVSHPYRAVAEIMAWYVLVNMEIDLSYI